MKRSHARQPARYGLVLSLLMAVAAPAGAEEPATPLTPPAPASPRDVLSAAQWRNVDRSIHRGLDYLAAQQREDGSFEAPPTGQPGVTALCVLAFLSRGHLPGEGPHGERINRAIDFVLTCQREDGMFSFIEPEPHHVHDGASHAGNYNHAIAGLMLGEVYGMTNPQLRERTKTAIPAGLQFLRRMQKKAKASPLDHGGWRYIRPRQGIDADLSATSWQLMSMRSARNAEFHVPKEWIEEAMAYIRRCFNNNRQTFSYTPHRSFNLITPGIVGGGIVSLSLGGEHNTEIAQLAGKSVLRYSFARYNTASFPYHYGAYYCSQAMYQLGGDYWTKFYPQLSKHLLANQRADGSWERENFNNGDYFGRSYTTSLSVLALTPAYQLLPIYQR
ncbi:Prenyltransferase and squalene oxidase repeat protein [Symmachiella dynata]|uniref:Prenyltransferase and squalene oxidase repeat protein n=1 Tax=Symmachiella dynata TaxID=2527995 RepID=A0A517ZTY0_9PLAN|nr:prenyltransferase/squalene oxidase repeat-containing protein [Symmachiella dynata]QDU45939.1 Prenyltransferase and squalene oxidase repeat protein [Symmachiella dynata]